ncbi:MAG: DMT family transporter [SAR324 cluster bacterium]|jgi:drug/metabolite transporter (DMT)-like permease|nr:DMT family transporter [SAR324 cluster bacterium]
MLSGINGVLYGITILIWGSSWIMIKFQVEVVSASISVFYRFFLAAIILQCLCLIKRQKSVYALREYIFIAIQGFCLFAVNYWLFYLSAEYLSSGLMALIFSTIVVMNMINGRIWFGTPINLKMVFGAMMGISGLTLVFWPEIQWEDSNYNMFKGLLLAFVATYFSSLGNIVSLRNQKKGIPVFYSNAYAMTFGCLTMLMITMITDEHWNFSWNPQFLLSLVFLSVFASVVGFWCYLTLLGRVGADRGAYATLIFPIVALSISTVFEGYQWSLIAISGVVLILLGNFIILKPSS